MLASFPEGQGCRALDPMYQMHRVPLHFAQGVDSPEAVGCAICRGSVGSDVVDSPPRKNPQRLGDSD